MVCVEKGTEVDAHFQSVSTGFTDIVFQFLFTQVRCTPYLLSAHFNLDKNKIIVLEALQLLVSR